MTTANQSILPQSMHHDMTYVLASYRDQAELILRVALKARGLETACRILVASLYTPAGETGQTVLDGKAWPIEDDRLPVGLWTRLHSRVEGLGGVHLYIVQGDGGDAREYGVIALPTERPGHRAEDVLVTLLGSLAAQEKAMVEHWKATGYLLMGPEPDSEHLHAILSWWARRTGSVPTGTRGPFGQGTGSRPTQVPAPPRKDEKVWGEWNPSGQVHDMEGEK